ncbi:NTP transferase domain-containing protein [Actibacterium sp. 188UL27-1]|uniref:nucleotidyltransferase family protein n=1 Tax=Actibacterium sp. 188UL27-1 TaxID=2786961 RepID=UPI001958BA40|nr:nucleotidyltransferase family protein [Actibacterium sp. 188UL27-1]MBM7067586.1 nucleotidyltransferase family protein [Actibacterium sp. 188UL27-1]
MIPILILAAGQSSRMRGTDKLLETVDGVPLLRHQAITALNVSDPVLITLPQPPHPRHDLLADLAVTPVPLPDGPMDMSASLRAGIDALPREATGVLVHLADMPDVTETDLRTIIGATRDHPGPLIWRATTAHGVPGHPILFDAALFPRFADLHGDRGARSVIEAERAQVHHVLLPHNHAITDLDTPEDWQNWRDRAGR